VQAHFIYLLESYCVLIVFVSVLIDQLGIPIPAVPVLIVAGSLAAHGKVSGVELLAAAVVATLIADGLWFLVGRIYGMRVLKTLCRISLEPDSCVSQTQNRFERWGVNSIVIAKFIPGLATIAPPLAGALHVTWRRFMGLSVLGSALWAGVGLGLGMAFNGPIAELERIGGIAATGFGIALVLYIAYKWRERHRFLAELRMARISVDELYELMGANLDPLILDVRTHTARGLEPHWIPSAIHAPVEEIEQRLQEFSRDREIIVYCTCPNEASAARVAKQLMKHGFTRVRPLHGGLDAWIAAGYPVDTHASARIDTPNDTLAGAVP
jgi:membrane protein DedA with SNARE-associated domain/rhodanese-related sulfurtransferase